MPVDRHGILQPYRETLRTMCLLQEFEGHDGRAKLTLVREELSNFIDYHWEKLNYAHGGSYCLCGITELFQYLYRHEQELIIEELKLKGILTIKSDNPKFYLKLDRNIIPYPILFIVISKNIFYCRDYWDWKLLINILEQKGYKVEFKVPTHSKVIVKIEIKNNFVKLKYDYNINFYTKLIDSRNNSFKCRFELLKNPIIAG